MVRQYTIFGGYRNGSGLGLKNEIFSLIMFAFPHACWWRTKADFGLLPCWGSRLRDPHGATKKELLIKRGLYHTEIVTGHYYGV